MRVFPFLQEVEIITGILLCLLEKGGTSNLRETVDVKSCFWDVSTAFFFFFF